MSAVILLVVIGTTVWVGFDSHNLGMRKGALNKSFLDLSTAGWVVACLLLWVIAFPCYFVARSKYQQLRSQAAFVPGGWAAPAYGGPSFGAYTAALQPGATPGFPYGTPLPTLPATFAAPPQLSPDGRWWWNGNQWTPVAVPPPSAPPS